MEKKIAGTETAEGLPEPLLLIILDGMGLYKGRTEGYPGNAIDLAEPAILSKLLNKEKIVLSLKAHGTAVGLPSDEDQGNSEVGHNAMGAGRIFAQGALLVNEAIADNRIFQSSAWRKLMDNSRNHGTPVHFIGLVSDGNVHSNVAHLMELLAQCDREGIEKAFVHGLLDGRDVPPLSALRYFAELEDYLWSVRRRAMEQGKKRRYCVASGGGRMVVTMDRYEADWSIVERGYNAHVLGEGPLFPDSLTAIRKLRQSSLADDQNLPPFVIHDESKTEQPCATIDDNHGVVLFNFRGDRALEISRAFVEDDFRGFTRKRRPRVVFAGMVQYDSDTAMPPLYLVEPPAFKNTLSEYLASKGVTQYALSETQKFGHVTYFWNGNNSAKFDEKLEVWEEIPSDRISFDKKPAMKAKEIADRAIEALRSSRYRFLRINFPNGDMVGHTGSLPAAVEAVKAVDDALGRIIAATDELGATVIVTADHGNCEQMIAVDSKTGEPQQGPGGAYKVMTSHSLNPVPFIIHGPQAERFNINKKATNPGLANIASTILTLLGLEKPPEYLDSLIISVE